MMKKIAIRILVFLVFLELCFWVGSWIAQGLQFWENARLARKSNVYRIMCVGDSITQAGEKDSYPAQLENVLNASSTRRFQVLNQGMAGEASSIIIQQLPQWLQNYRPDMVLVMLGVGDGEMAEAERPDPIWKKMIGWSMLYRLTLQLSEQGSGVLKDYAARFPGGRVRPVTTPKEVDIDFARGFAKQPDEIKKPYLFARLAEGHGRYDVAEKLYEQFLQKCQNPILTGWVIKEYGVLLLKAKLYQKYVANMPRIPFDAWNFDWVRAYCTTPQNMEEVRGVIEGMVNKGTNPMVYGYIASCYDNGGEKERAAMYYKKMEDLIGRAFSPQTQQNLRAIKKALLDKGIRPVFVQYPVRDVRPLMAVFSQDMDRDKIAFVDNGPVFRKALAEQPYNVFFHDRAKGDFGHGTKIGNRLLAENVAKTVLRVVGSAQ